MRTDAFPELARAFYESCHARITSRLRLGFDRDGEARDHVETWLGHHPGAFADPVAVLARVHPRPGEACIIHAPGPTLPSVARELAARPGASRDVTITVDGATRFFLEEGLPVDAFVTDLDGMSPADVDRALDLGCAAAIHVHGDNIEAVTTFLSRHVNEVGPALPVLFTTQAEPVDLVFNLGGFTDGDRAIFVAIAAGFTRILLASMDLNRETTGAYSKPGSGVMHLDAHPVKREKLAIATAVLRWLSTRLPPGVSVSTTNMERPLPMFPNVWL